MDQEKKRKKKTPPEKERPFFFPWRHRMKVNVSSSIKTLGLGFNTSKLLIFYVCCRTDSPPPSYGKIMLVDSGYI